MFRFIQSKLFLQLVCVLALLTWAVLQFIGATHYVQDTSTSSFWQMLSPLQNHYGGMIAVISFGLLLQILLTDVYYFRGGFGDNHHLMVCIWFLLILCCGGYVSELSPVWLTNLMLAIIISLNFDYDSGNLKSKDLLSGILTGVASLFYPPMVFVAFFVISSLIINRFSKYKDIIVYILGILLVCIYIFSFYFISNRLPELYQFVSGIRFYNTFAMTEMYSWQVMVLIATTVVSLLYATIVLKIQYDSKTVILRKKLITIHLITMSCLLLMVFSPFDIHQAVGFLIIPMSLYYSMLSQMKEHTFINDIMMLIFVVALCL
jgi:hypothetical protein